MSQLINLYCIDKNYHLASDNTAQNCFFIIADTQEHKIYCYTKLELETMRTSMKLDIEGIVFHACSPHKIVRWTNQLDNSILAQSKVVGRNHIYQTFSVLDLSYSIARMVSGSSFWFKRGCFKIGCLNSALSFNAKTSIYPALMLDKDAVNLNSADLRAELRQYKGISSLLLTGITSEIVDLTDVELKGVATLSGAFSRAFNLHTVKMGRLDLSCLESVYHMFSSSPKVTMVDFSQTVGDLDKRIGWHWETIRDKFELSDIGGHSINYDFMMNPCVIYLNKDSVLFNKLLVSTNPKFKMLTGIVPYSDMVEQTKRIIGKQMLMGKVDKANQRFFIRVDNKA